MVNYTLLTKPLHDTKLTFFEKCTGVAALVDCSVTVVIDENPDFIHIPKYVGYKELHDGKWQVTLPFEYRFNRSDVQMNKFLFTDNQLSSIKSLVNGIRYNDPLISILSSTEVTGESINTNRVTITLKMPNDIFIIPCHLLPNSYSYNGYTYIELNETFIYSKECNDIGREDSYELGEIIRQFKLKEA